MRRDRRPRAHDDERHAPAPPVDLRRPRHRGTAARCRSSAIPGRASSQGRRRPATARRARRHAARAARCRRRTARTTRRGCCACRGTAPARAERVGQLDVHVAARALLAQRELVVEERDVERRVVDDPFGAAREVEELGREVAKPRPGLRSSHVMPWTLGRGCVDLALGIEVECNVPARRSTVDELDAGELDDPMPLLGIEAGRFGVDDWRTAMKRIEDRGSRERPDDASSDDLRYPLAYQLFSAFGMLDKTPPCAQRQLSLDPRSSILDPRSSILGSSIRPSPTSGTSESSPGSPRSRARSRRRSGRAACPCDRSASPSCRAPSGTRQGPSSR